MSPAGLLLFALAAVPAAGAADAPAWVKDAVVDRRREDASAVILLDEQTLTVSGDGKTRTTRRYVARVNDRSGRAAAAIREIYITGSGRIRQVRGWILSADGRVRELGDRVAVDVALVNNDVFNDVRARVLAAGDDLAPGDVFAAEIESEDRLLFAQLEWQMQHSWPARSVRRSLTLPAGWQAKAVVFNAAAIEPTRTGATLTWELRGLAALPLEPAMPPVSDLAPRVAVSLYGPPDAPAPGQFERWEQVASWLHALADNTSQAPESVAAKAREITASAANDFERARAIGVYAQRVQYVSIQTGLGRGGGYQPRAPALVLERNYGDCKDKAGLMRAMLAAVGIRSQLVSIYAGDRNYVRAEWPSPQQFNHAIIAISLTEVPAGTPAALEHAVLGKLVVFDPTDEHTVFGELPLHEQGSLALLVTASGGTLMKMPVAPADRHAVERTFEGEIDAAGDLTAVLRQRFSGESGRSARAERNGIDGAAYRALVERRIGARLSRAVVGTLSAADDRMSGAFAVDAELTVKGFGQAQGNLLLLALPFGGGSEDIPADTKRRTAVLLEPRTVIETHRLKLPPGYGVDELPETVSLVTPFGRFELAYSGEGEILVARRTLRLPLQKIEPTDYAALAQFFSRIRAADAVPALLVRR